MVFDRAISFVDIDVVIFVCAARFVAGGARGTRSLVFVDGGEVACSGWCHEEAFADGAGFCGLRGFALHVNGVSVKPWFGSGMIREVLKVVLTDLLVLITFQTLVICLF